MQKSMFAFQGKSLLQHKSKFCEAVASQYLFNGIVNSLFPKIYLGIWIVIMHIIKSALCFGIKAAKKFRILIK